MHSIKPNYRARVPQPILKLFTIWMTVFFLLTPSPAGAYSVLSHEEIIDLAWHDQIVPLLLERFPNTTSDQLREAHSYAYGGCIIQDIGYYPHGSHLFSDLLHYIRTGDFVLSLLREASDVNELAFALGALAHHTADTYGHPAVNLATGAEYPKLRDKFGDVVTYDDDHTAHLQTEFGFDVVEVAHNRYAPQQYHDFIGFSVSKPLLERAFRDTYGFEVNQIMPSEDRAINTYRHTVSSLLPRATRVAVINYEKEMKQEDPSYDRRKFIYRVDKATYKREYGNEYQKPGAGAEMLAFFIRILPKIGPLKALELHMPDAQSQQEFLKSMNNVVDHYTAYLKQLRQEPAAPVTLDLADLNLDTGNPTESGRYRLADFTYAQLLAEIEKHPETPIPAALRANVMAFYQPGQSNYVSLKPKEWQQTKNSILAIENAQLVDLKVSDQSTKDQQAPVAAMPH
ncbi:MAG TPA: zinc dependent phospholipase C family protein [Silvibacterium sp.]|nr:zinc dependent phospholipase C family protein [Silvibacterium sp.]